MDKYIQYVETHHSIVQAMNAYVVEETKTVFQEREDYLMNKYESIAFLIWNAVDEFCNALCIKNDGKILIIVTVLYRILRHSKLMIHSQYRTEWIGYSILCAYELLQ